MPKVGKKHFAYTEKGMRAARAESARTGKPVTGPKGRLKKLLKKLHRRGKSED